MYHAPPMSSERHHSTEGENPYRSPGVEDLRSEEQKKIDERRAKVRGIVYASLGSGGAVMVTAFTFVGGFYYSGFIDKSEAQVLTGLFLIAAPAMAVTAVLATLFAQRNILKKLMEGGKEEKLE